MALTKDREALPAPKLRALCRWLLDLAQTHPRNDLFLAKFRAFVDSAELQRFLTVKCVMLSRFRAFYADATRPRRRCTRLMAVVLDVIEYYAQRKEIDDEDADAAGAAEWPTKKVMCLSK